MKEISLLIVLVLIRLINCVKEDEVCSEAVDCKSCMEKGPFCKWCNDGPNSDQFSGASTRCGTTETLLIRGCKNKTLISNKSERKSLVSRAKRESNKEQNDDLLKPLLQEIGIRPGMPLDMDISYQSVGDYPVDLYYLTDMSYSMRDDLATVSSMTQTIEKEFSKMTKRFRMGFGGFVDKPLYPFINPSLSALKNPCENVAGNTLQCTPTFLYKHYLSVTSNFTEFQKRTKATKPSGNLDAPEGGLDALLQVAYCDDIIGWQSNARKIVLYTSDGGFHVAGDGKLAGLITPPPQKCVVTKETDQFGETYVGWHSSTFTDYPSIGEVASVMKKKGINIIFATDKSVKFLYEKLTHFLPNAAVGVIEKGSGNIVQLLKENYRKIISKVTVSVEYDKKAIKVTVLTKCHGQKNFTETNVCSKHPVDGIVNYKLNVDIIKCFNGTKTVTVHIEGLKNNATINVKSACECKECKSMEILKKHAVCNSRGNFHCGICKCSGGFKGDFCECSAKEASTVDSCKANDKTICSGVGDCVCGRCKCRHSRYSGKYCECDKEGCPLSDDMANVCGGKQRGTCNCNNTCTCKPGYSGNACDCLSSNAQCENPNNSSMPKCTGRGICHCGICFCNVGYGGDRCEFINENKKVGCDQEKDKELTSCMLCIYNYLVVDNKPVHLLTADSIPILSGKSAINVKYNKAGGLTENNNVTFCAGICKKIPVDKSRLKLIDVNDNQRQDADVCILYDKGCRVYVYYQKSKDILIKRSILMTFQIQNECPDSRSLIIIIAAVIVTIVCLGLFLLLIWKLVVTIDDRRENAIYQEQLKNAKWETEENPIFKPPVTTVKNPLYRGEDDY